LESVTQSCGESQQAKLQKFCSHVAGGGTRYVTIGTIGEEVKIRFANHENTSFHHDSPEFNCVNRYLTAKEIEAIKQKVSYPRLCKKTALAKHVGLTVPKLKKLLDDSCYEQVCENVGYPNTFTQYVLVTPALERLASLGVIARIPIQQETWTWEDFDGKLF
jgi:hypothetical protein